MNWLIVFLGGGVGSVLRYGVGKICTNLFSGMQFPLGTFLSNFFSCLIFAGTLMLFFNRSGSNSPFQLLLLTGICGGFSTFSTFSYETFVLFQKQEYLLAGVNIILNLSCCLLAFMVIVKRLS